MGLIHVKNIPELDVLRYEGEDKAAFIKLSPEVILIRWLNYHLKKAGSKREASNFTSDLAVRRKKSFILIVFLEYPLLRLPLYSGL
jgi:hypothetical protein